MKTSGASQIFNAVRVSHLCKISLRQLQWWDEKGIVSPRIEHHKRLYVLSEVLAIWVVAKLRRRAFSLQQIRRVLHSLKANGKTLIASLETPDEDIYVLTNGKDIYIEKTQAEVIDRMKRSCRPMSLLCVTDLRSRLRAKDTVPPATEGSSGEKQ